MEVNVTEPIKYFWSNLVHGCRKCVMLKSPPVVLYAAVKHITNVKIISNLKITVVFFTFRK